MKICVYIAFFLSSVFSFSQDENKIIDSCFIRMPQTINSSCPPAGGDRIRYNCIPDTFNLKIFSRWGDLVFETTEIDIILDELIDQSDTTGNNKLPQGIYYYIFNAKFQNRKELKDIVGYIFKAN